MSNILFKKLKELKSISISKSLYWSFKLFPWKSAIRIPLFVYPNTVIKVSGTFIPPHTFNTDIHTGMIRIGQPLTWLIDKKCSTYLDVVGSLMFKGNTIIGHGSKILIGRSGKLTIGERFSVSGCLRICCEHNITIGCDCMFSWDVSLLDTDYHPIVNQDGIVTNPPRPISIGNHVWIGCNNTILKGVSIADNIVVSSRNTVKTSLRQSNSIYGEKSDNITLLKESATWSNQIFDRI